MLSPGSGCTFERRLMSDSCARQIVFTSLALFGVLIAPLNSFPWVINGCVEAAVSMRRLQRYACSPRVHCSLQMHV